MARKSSKTKSNKKKQNGIESKEDLISVDPSRVRFQHSKIRPFFSGCGRSVVGTLTAIRNHEISPGDLPPIQVIVGPDTKDGPWYFSLNNRRLWVLKRCREEGLLKDNTIQVRVRKPKSEAEAARYSIQNCALEAKIMKEGTMQKKREEIPSSPVVETATKAIPNHPDMQNAVVESAEERKEEEDDILSSDDDDDDDNDAASKNPFSLLE